MDAAIAFLRKRVASLQAEANNELAWAVRDEELAKKHRERAQQYITDALELDAAANRLLPIAQPSNS